MKKKRSDSEDVQLSDGPVAPAPAPSATQPTEEAANPWSQQLGAAAVCVRVPDTQLVVCGLVVGPAPSATGDVGTADPEGKT